MESAMEYFVKCVIYLCVLGILSHIIGEAVPRRWIMPDRPPYVSWSWEKNGRVYEQLNIRAWKDKLPDMSRVMKRMVPKRLTAGASEEAVERLIEETCIAETTHVMLMLMSVICINIWPGRGGVIIALLFSAGNVPFIIVQRYNRPKLKRLLEMMRRRKNKSGNAEAAAEVYVRA